jgi:Cu+-exporting ATPase
MTTIVYTDPICGMTLQPETATATYEYAGWLYLFCCEECRNTFARNPNACVLTLAHTEAACIGLVCTHQRAGQVRRGMFR